MRGIAGRFGAEKLFLFKESINKAAYSYIDKHLGPK